MSQGTLIFPTSGILPGLTLVQMINDALDNLATHAAGTVDPATLAGGVQAYSFWMDTSASPSVLKIRRPDNAGWIAVAQISATAFDLAAKGQPGGYASLDGAGLVPTSQLPSYVDQVLEYPTRSAFPATGQASKIYVAVDTMHSYRWSGSIYIDISSTVDSVNGQTGAVTLTATDITATDGASGSLWTTVQGFISKIISSAGASVIGFVQAGAGAVLRSLQDKSREIPSVKDFGAVGDGVFDDAGAFSSASAVSGGLSPVFVPAGIYKINSAVTGKFVTLGGVTITGSGSISSLVTVGDLTFTDLSDASTPVANTDLLILRQGSVNKKLAVSVFRTELATDAQAAAATAQSAAATAQSYSSVLIKQTKALLDADLAYPADKIGRVVQDANLANNGDYIKVGASGSGSWTKLNETQTGTNKRRIEEVESAYIVPQQFGPTTPATGTAAGNVTYAMAVQIRRSGYITQFKAPASAGGTVKLQECSISGGTLTVLQEVSVTLVTGSNTLIWPDSISPMKVTAGNYLAVFGNGVLTRTTGLNRTSTPYYSIAGTLAVGGTAAVSTITSSVRLEAQIVVTGRVTDLTTLAALPADILTSARIVSQTIGLSAPAASGSSLPSATRVLVAPIQDVGRLKQIVLPAQGDGEVFIKLFRYDWTATTTPLKFVSQFSAFVQPGVNTLNFPVDLPDVRVGGQYHIGIYTVAADLLYTQTVSSTVGTVSHWSFTGNASTDQTPGTANTTSSLQVKFIFDILNSVDGRVSDDTLHLQVRGGQRLRVARYGGAGFWMVDEVEKVLTTGTGLGGSANCWRLRDIKKYTRSWDGQYHFIGPVTASPSGSGITSERGKAIKTNGAADFVGGYVHGFEQMTATPILVLDGEVIDVSVSGTYTGRRLEWIAASDLYMQGTDVTNAANKLCSNTEYVTWEGERTDIRQVGTWLRNVTIANAYIGMLPMAGREVTYGGFQIDFTARPTTWSKTDLRSTSGAVDSGNASDRAVWGSVSKLRARMQHTNGWSTAASCLSRVEVNLPGYSATSFTATAGQTSFTMAYTVGDVYLVTVNGTEVAYTATSGTAVVLTVAANAGDAVVVYKSSAASTGNVKVYGDYLNNVAVTNGQTYDMASTYEIVTGA